MTHPLDIGDGLGVDPLTLRTVVLDAAAFSARDLLAADDPGFRVRALAADVAGARCDHAVAILAAGDQLASSRLALARVAELLARPG